MNYRKLGNSGLYVSELSLGSWLTYGNATDNSTSHKVIETAYENGINFFDTANGYAAGSAERVVGEALGKYPRGSYVLATKVYVPMGPGITERGLSRKHIMDQIDESLKRLGMDYVDIYYCHRYDDNTPLEETLRAMDDLITQGKIRYLGVSNWSALQISKAIALADKFMFDKIIVSQPPYNMFAREIETELIPFCEENGIGQAVYSPLAQGILSGKYVKSSKLPEDSRAADPKANRFISRYLDEEKLSKTAAIKEISDELGISMPVLALSWVLRQKNVSSAIIGASKPQQVLENIKASEVTLYDDILDRIESILA